MKRKRENDFLRKILNKCIDGKSLKRIKGVSSKKITIFFKRKEEGYNFVKLKGVSSKNLKE